MQALLTILSVIIGLVFVLLLFSLLASTVMEILAAMLSLRGKHLLTTLESMLGSHADDFIRHPFFKQLSYAAHHKRRLSDYQLPAWISKSTFSSILMDVLHGDRTDEIEYRVRNMPDSDFKKLLLYLLRESDGSPESLKEKLEHWFEEVMERASEWYKRSTKWWLFGIGLVMAAIFNADTIQIYQSLSANSRLAEGFVQQAEQFAARRDSVPAIRLDKPLGVSTSEFREIAETYKHTVQSPLGLGWTSEQGGDSLPDWLVRLAGWIITGIAVTFGAPFWFEALKKLLAIRGSQAASASVPPPVSGGKSRGKKEDEDADDDDDDGSLESTRKRVAKTVKNTPRG